MSGKEKVTFEGTIDGEKVTIQIDRDILVAQGVIHPKEIRSVGIVDPFVDGGRFAEARSGKGTGGGPQDPCGSRLPTGDDAGAAEIQPNPIGISDRGDVVFSRDPARFSQARSFATGRVVEVKYLNWRGEMRVRRILPWMDTMRFGETEWHPGKQWLFSAVDLEDCKIKEFAMSGIFGWNLAEDQSLPWRS